MSFTHARARHDFGISEAVSAYSFNPTFILALWRTAAHVRGGGGRELEALYTLFLYGAAVVYVDSQLTPHEPSSEVAN